MQTVLKHRCHWCTDDPIYIDYHDHEWGVPVHDNIRLFEMLALEGSQAGLSWLTILKKRENYRKAFDGFRPEIVAAYGPRKIEALLNNPGIVRNKLKIEATIHNARHILEIQDEFGSLDSYLWYFVDGRPIRHAWKDIRKIPCQTKESDLMSRELQRRDLKFVGTKICYAFMQAVGMVNDHEVSCFRHGEVKKLARK
jgi:DNA-3-methyladenine glycosylase I